MNQRKAEDTKECPAASTDQTADVSDTIKEAIADLEPITPYIPKPKLKPGPKPKPLNLRHTLTPQEMAAIPIDQFFKSTKRLQDDLRFHIPTETTWLNHSSHWANITETPARATVAHTDLSRPTEHNNAQHEAFPHSKWAKELKAEIIAGNFPKNLIHQQDANKPSISLIPLYPKKNAKAYTHNMAILAHDLPKEQLSVLVYLIAAAKPSNQVIINTILYKKYLSFLRVFRSKPNNDNFPLFLPPYKKFKQQIISLSNSHILIKLHPKKQVYLVNPMVAHVKMPTGTTRAAQKFSDDYQALKELDMLMPDTLLVLAEEFLAATKRLMNEQYNRFKRHNAKKKDKK